MKLAFIVPVNHMEETKRGDILYILAHLLKNKKYYDYCKKSKQYKIIDNSVHEGEEIPLDEYVRYAIELKVNEIILQDVMDNCKKTIELVDKQIFHYGKILKENNIKIMAVIQGKTIEQFDRCFWNYQMKKQIDVIGISFTMCIKQLCVDKYMNYFINRQLLMEHLHQLQKTTRNKIKPVHLLGSSSWQEPILLKKYNFIRSNDTKLLARLAKSKELLPRRLIGKPSKKITMYETFTDTQKAILKLNINLVRELVKDGK